MEGGKKDGVRGNGMQYSLMRLLGLMAFIALGLGALAGASGFMVNAVFTATVLAFCAAVVGAFLASGQARAFWLGFLVFGGSHLILALLPWLSDRTGNHLLSRDAIDALGQIMGHMVMNRHSMPGVWEGLGAYGASTPPYLFTAFVIIGQCWFTIAIGWLGGLAASAYVRRQARGQR